MQLPRRLPSRKARLLAPALWVVLAMFAASHVGLARTAHATASDDAVAVVERTVAELFEAMRAEREAIAADASRVQPLVREIVLPRVDLDTVSQLVLGKHWRTATTEEKAAFQKEFRTLLVRTYSDALSQAVDAEVEITNGANSQDGTQTLVRSRVKRGDAPVVALAYRLAQGTDGGWRVIDITIEGVSLVTTWRSEFSSMIGKHGVSGLISHIAKRNTNTAS
jgi:phospholipid transport system substrate-binding protein